MISDGLIIPILAELTHKIRHPWRWSLKHLGRVLSSVCAHNVSVRACVRVFNNTTSMFIINFDCILFVSVDGLPWHQFNTVLFGMNQLIADRR